MAPLARLDGIPAGARILAAVSPDDVAGASTADLRERFLVSGLFVPGEARLAAWETDRTVIGGLVPLLAPLHLAASWPGGGEPLARREAGILNLGGPGWVETDDARYPLVSGDAVYLGRGTGGVRLGSDDPEHPAEFYLLSYPAHATHPSELIRASSVQPLELGSPEKGNRRTLFKLIHPGRLATCQLVMGLTILHSGSVWNTFPPHTHPRRSEVYLYHGLPADGVVFHFVGRPDELRHVVVRDREAVLSPSWSVHFGAGSSAYRFVWGMGGENQDFDDMDPAPAPVLR